MRFSFVDLCGRCGVRFDRPLGRECRLCASCVFFENDDLAWQVRILEEDEERRRTRDAAEAERDSSHLDWIDLAVSFLRRLDRGELTLSEIEDGAASLLHEHGAP